MVNRQKKMLGWIDTIKKGSRALLGKELSGALNKKAVGLVGSFKKGGKVSRTGLAKVHKGEVVLSATQAKQLKKMLH
jgi:hypothetical protein